MENLKSLTTKNTVGVTDTGYVVLQSGSPKPIAVLVTQQGDASIVGRNGAGAEDVLSIAMHMVGEQCDAATPNNEEEYARLDTLREAYSNLLIARAKLIAAYGLEPDVL